MRTAFAHRLDKAQLRAFFEAAIAHLDSPASKANPRLAPAVLDQALDAFVEGDLARMGEVIDFCYFPAAPWTEPQ